MYVMTNRPMGNNCDPLMAYSLVRFELIFVDDKQMRVFSSHSVNESDTTNTTQSKILENNRFFTHMSIMNKVFIILSVLVTVSLVSVFHENESMEFV